MTKSSLGRAPLLATVCAIAGIVLLRAQDLPQGYGQGGSAEAPALRTVGAADTPAVLGGDAVPDFIVSPGGGTTPTQVLDGVTGALLGAGEPFGAGFSGGVRVAAGDLSGDGVADLVLGMGPGGGLVTLLNGSTIAPLGSGYPFGASFAGGVSVAMGDFNGDGSNDIAAGQASGGGMVAVFDGRTYTPLLSSAPFGSYGGGVNIAAGDVDSDGRADLFVGQASGGEVALVNGATGAVTLRTTAFATPGVWVAVGDVNGDGAADLVAAPGAGNAPVYVYDVVRGAMITVITPYAPAVTGGVRVAVADLTGDGRAEIVTVPGPGGPATLKVFDGATFAEARSYAVLDQAFTGGALVALPVVTGLRFVSAASATFRVGTAGSFQVQTVGSPVATTMSATGALPPGVTFVDNGSGRATIAGTPQAGSGGTYALTLRAQNALRTVTQAFTLTVNESPTITSAATATFNVGGSGAFAITAAGFPRPTLSLTGTLPTGITFTPGSNGTAELSGLAATGTSGTYPLTLRATNGIGADAVQNFTLYVRTDPAFTSAASTTFTTGAAGSFSITTTAIPPVTGITSTGTLPSGVTFVYTGSGTATLSGSPAAGTGGLYALTFQAGNGVATTDQNFVLTVRQPAGFTSAASTAFVVGAPGSFSVTTSGYPAPSVSVTGTLPTGVTFVDHGDGTATFGGTPAAGQAGTYNLTLTATNGVGAPSQQAFVLSVNQPAVINSANATTFTVGQAGSFVVSATGVPTPTVSIASGTLPSGVTLTPNGNGTATLAGTPATGSQNTYPLQLSATNGVGSPGTQAFTLTVTCPAVTVSPAAGALPAGEYGSAYSQTISATGGSGHQFTVTTGALPGGLTLSTGGALTGAPTATGTFAFTVTATAAGGCTGTAAYTLTIAPNAQAESFSNGVGNVQYSVGAGTPATPAVVVAGSVLSNDGGPGSLTAGPANIATTNGGQVAMASDGTFLYTPAVGFAGPADTFTYTLTDGNGATDTAVVTINMSGVVWFVNATAGAGDGRSHSPFNSVSAATTAAQIQQYVYVHSGSPSGAAVLKTGQTLWGAGDTFVLNGLTIPASTTPTLSGTVTLANGAAVRAVAINAGGAPAVTANGLSGAETLTNVTITGGTVGLNLINLGGSLSVNGGAISGVSAGGVLVSGGAGTLAIASPVTTAAAHSVTVTGRSGGSVTFSGAITDTGTGILLTNNPGSAVAFSGGLSLTTGANDAFVATGGGSVTATQDNVTIVNTIATVEGAALRVTNTDIGAAGLTFRAISSGSAVTSTGNGIVLDTTGLLAANGGLTVTGNGTATSGGRIRRKTGADNLLTEGIGVYLNATKPVSLSWMEINDTANGGIVGRNLAGLSLLNSALGGTHGSNVTLDEGPIVLGTRGSGGVNGVTGTLVLTDSVIEGGVRNNVSSFSHSGSLAVTLSGTAPEACQVLNNSSVSGEHGVLVESDGTASVTVNVATCRVRNHRLGGLVATAADTASLTLSVSNSEFVRSTQGDEGIVARNSGDAQLTSTITNTQFYDFAGAAIRVGQTAGNASALSLLRATIVGNTVQQQPGSTTHAILAELGSTAGAAARTRLLVDGNLVVTGGVNAGVGVRTFDASAATAADVTIVNNHIDMLDTVNGLVGLLVNVSQPGINLCANVSSNTSHFYPVTGAGGGVRVEQSSGVFRLERGLEPLGTPAGTVIVTNNANGPAGASQAAAAGTITIVENGTCQVP